MIQNDDYTDQVRKDEVVSLGLNVAYSPNSFLNFGVSAFYSENDSNIGLDYTNSVLEFSASLRY